MLSCCRENMWCCVSIEMLPTVIEMMQILVTNNACRLDEQFMQQPLFVQLAA